MKGEYDSYGFPTNNKVESRSDDVIKWLKIGFWLFLVFLILKGIIGLILFIFKYSLIRLEQYPLSQIKYLIFLNIFFCI